MALEWNVAFHVKASGRRMLGGGEPVGGSCPSPCRRRVGTGDGGWCCERVQGTSSGQAPPSAARSFPGNSLQSVGVWSKTGTYGFCVQM